MASLRRLPRSPNYIACFTGHDGRRYQRSTKVRADGRIESRRRAQRIADEYEDVARKKRSASHVHQVIRELFHEAYAQALPNSSFAIFAETWLASKSAEVSTSTLSAYKEKISSFESFLGARANKPLADISPDDIRGWRDQEAMRVSASTVNHGLKMLRVFFGCAKREGLIAENPTENIPTLKRTDVVRRRPFTLDEICRLLKNADAEWTNMIVFGLYTGQRIGDIARLTWDQIDIENQEIRITTKKTGRNQKIPIPPPLQSHLVSLPKPECPDLPVHPRANAILLQQGRVSTLSRQFRDLMSQTGLIKETKHRKAEGNGGRKSRRDSSRISFHSLRHTTTSLLKNAGVSPAIAEEFVGHDSAEMNRVYTHIDLSAMQKAAATLPDVLATTDQEPGG